MIPPAKTPLHAASTRDRSSPSEPTSQVGPEGEPEEDGEKECLRCSATNTASLGPASRTTTSLLSAEDVIQRKSSTCLPELLLLVPLPAASSRILGTLIPMVVASKRKVCVARWLDEMRETERTSISNRRLATACKEQKKKEITMQLDERVALEGCHR